MLAHLVLVNGAINREVEGKLMVVHEKFEMPVTWLRLEGRSI